MNAQVAQVAVAQPVGKGQLVSVWQLHLEFVVLKGHNDLRVVGGRVSGRQEAPWEQARAVPGVSQQSWPV